MKTMQKKILESLNSMAENKKIDMVVNFDFSNTGTAYFQKEFFNVATLNFSFQHSYCTFTLSQISENSTDFYIEYRANSGRSSVTNFMSKIKECLDRW